MKLADLHNAPVKLLWVEGEGAEEFADLIGASGKLTKSCDGLTFMPDGRGDWLTFVKPRLHTKLNDRSLRIRSVLGLTYVFKRLDNPTAETKR